MNLQTSSAARLASALLIAGIVTVGCGRHDAGQGTQPAGTDPAAAASPVAAATLTPPPGDATPDVTASPDASDSAAPAASYSPPATADDPVTGDIQSIDQLLKGIDGSVSGADSGSTGGE
ncbi:MAG: hypothetical protein ABSD62_02650 [Candidatus Limnocylindrales bacterium]